MGGVAFLGSLGAIVIIELYVLDFKKVKLAKNVYRYVFIRKRQCMVENKGCFYFNSLKTAQKVGVFY